MQDGRLTSKSGLISVTSEAAPTRLATSSTRDSGQTWMRGMG